MYTVTYMEPTDHKVRELGLIEFDEDEELVCVIRKHPFGFFLTLMAGLMVLVFVVAVGTLIQIGIERSSGGLLGELSGYSWAIVAITIILSVISLILTLVSAYVYTKSLILVTSEKIAQIIYTNLVTRKISQLNIADVQDVTVSQAGFFARLFKYGTLVIETAGEQQNYTFTFTPNPNHFSKEIISAREKNVGLHGN